MEKGINRNSSKKIGILIGALVVAIIAAVVTLHVLNEKSITLSIENGAEYTIEPGDELKAVTAVYAEALFKPEGEGIEVKMDGVFDANKAGTYSLRYYAEHNGVTAEALVTVTIRDLTAPEIVLTGGNDITIRAGEKYQEPGFTAIDNCDGDVTSQVVVSGEPKVNGTYTMTYTVTDSSGNTAEVKRNVKVVVEDDQKVVYLTFDDGPCVYTEELLDLLDRYGVKVTFFVTNGQPKYQDMIGEAFRRGHTIALHTYSHKYSIYKSEETYFADLQKIQDIVVAQTGQEAKIIRFPGGTSNTISRNHCRGIMSTLAKRVVEEGYAYCDWNVSSGDADGADTAEEVAANVIKGISRTKQAIVLQHDIKRFSIQAVDDIIEWGQANGYIFLPMTEDMKMYQHNPQN